MAAIYTLTIFTSAFLLFLVQPMISKLLLPHLGGSPAVWNTAMVFFQSFVLLGYLYTHFSGKYLGTKRQVWLHIILLLVSLIWLPIALETNLSFSSSEYPISWIIVSLLLSLGLPFFLLATNAPLIQHWIANSNHPSAKNPYFLYSASNVGSLLALLSYPFIIEPVFGLSEQTFNWSFLYGLYVVLVVACAILLYRNYKPISNPDNSTDKVSIAPSTKLRLYWLALAFFPSSLMLGVTTYIATDIASMPLFWVIPLALYLITFIIAFSKYGKTTDYALSLQTLIVPLVAFTMVYSMNDMYMNIAIHLTAFFVSALACHGLLARNKPSPKYLTEFYVWMSFGGMLGGLFNSIIAPQLFTKTIEYSLVFVGCLLVRPIIDKTRTHKQFILDAAIPGLFTAILIAIFYIGNEIVGGYAALLRDPTQIKAIAETLPSLGYASFLVIMVTYIVIMIAIDLTYKRPLRLTLIIASLFLSSHLYHEINGSSTSTTYAYEKRNFFGTTRILHNDNSSILVHGTTRHGFQSREPEYKNMLSSYYVPLKTVREFLNTKARKQPYAVIGLGAGTTACMRDDMGVIDFYEIDPDMVAVAKNTKYFTYLRDCKSAKNIIIGDGRIKIGEAKDQHYGLIVVDAFSSDAIPVHLLTKEAVQTYANKLHPNGVIALHVSNRYLELEPIAARIGTAIGLTAIEITKYEYNKLDYGSSWVLLTRDQQYVERTNKYEWKLLRPNIEDNLWTDQYSNIIDVIR